MNAPDVTIAPHVIRPYGDTTGDGMVQVSFTLPIPHDKRAEGAALQLAAQTVTGAAQMVLQTGKHPAALRELQKTYR